MAKISLKLTKLQSEVGLFRNIISNCTLFYPNTLVKEGGPDAPTTPLDEETTSDEESTSEDEQQITTRHRPLKSGMNRTGMTMVIKRIMWPYEVVYSLAGKPVAYEDLSVSAFVQGYLIVIHSEDSETKNGTT